METVTILKETYDELVKDQAILDALYASGVDNWEWYDDAMKSLEEDTDD
jgi:hypothetical protein